MFTLPSCKRSEIPQALPPQSAILPTGASTRSSGPSAGVFTSDREYNLNVIYFVPKDLTALPDYERRLSELLLWAQNWVKQQMANSGYPNKTFGMFTNADKTRIRIITVYGSKTKDQYPYLGGNGAVYEEVNAYFTANPSLKKSMHNLIILPYYKVEADGTLSGGPFYGTGRDCYALDYEGMDIKNLGKTDAAGRVFSAWFGGMVHELGHGLNLPHNRQKVSENNDPQKGMSLMWAGNGTLGISPTFLTATDCAILNVNQVFNPGTDIYYGPATASITRIHASYEASSSSILLSGRFTSSVPVNSVVYYNDPNVNNEGTGVNHDYNAITWESKTIGTDSFYVKMPISELEYKDNATPYDLKVKLVHTNGTITETLYTYKFTDGIPVLNFSTRNELSKQGWTIKSFSSEETTGEGAVNGRAATLIDNNVSTFWHSKWSNPAANYPHEVVVDMASIKSAKGLSLTQRNGLSRAVKNFEIQISNDGVNFSPMGNFVAENINGPQYFNFGSPQSFRYFKVIAKSAWDGEQFAALAELGLI